MVKTQASFLPLVLVTPKNMQYFSKVKAKRLQNFDSRGSLFQPVWIYEGAKTPTFNFRAVGVFGSPQDKFAFSVLLCACSLENASSIFSCFLATTLKLDLASLLKERRYFKKW